MKVYSHKIFDINIYLKKKKHEANLDTIFGQDDKNLLSELKQKSRTSQVLKKKKKKMQKLT